MLKALYYVQAGFMSPQKLQQDESTKRTYGLQLSRYHDVEPAHSSSVNSLDLDIPDERYLLSGCADGSLYIHDLLNLSTKPQHTAKCVCKVPKGAPGGHRHGVRCVSWYAQDNGLFLSSSTDSTLKVWDANSLQPVETYKLKGRVFQHHCSPIPTSHPVVAVVGSEKNVDLIDLRTGSAVHELRGHSAAVLTARWSPATSHLLASGGVDNRILLWDTRAAKACLRSLDQHNATAGPGSAHAGCVNGLAFSRDGLLLVSCGTDDRLRLWETLHGHHQMVNYGKVANSQKYSQLEVSAGCKPELVFTPSEARLVVSELVSGRRVGHLSGHFKAVNCCVYRRGYQELYSGGNDRNVLLWSAEEPQLDAPEDVECDEGGQRRWQAGGTSRRLIAAGDAWSSDEDG